jgi:MFS family permease
MQLNSDDAYRGRVMSVYSLVFGGSTPIGNLYTGIFTDRFGARVGFGACGLAIVLLLIPVYIVRKLRKPPES